MNYSAFSEDAWQVFSGHAKAAGFSIKAFHIEFTPDVITFRVGIDRTCHFAIEYIGLTNIFFISSSPNIQLHEKTLFMQDLGSCVPMFCRWLEKVKSIFDIENRFFFADNVTEVEVKPYVLHPTEPLSRVQRKALMRIALKASFLLQAIDPPSLSQQLYLELKSLYASVRNAPQGYAHFALVGFLLTRGSQHPALVGPFSDLAEVITSRILLS